MLLQMFMLSLFDHFHYTFIVPYVSKKFCFQVQISAVLFASLLCACDAFVYNCFKCVVHSSFNTYCCK